MRALFQIIYSLMFFALAFGSFYVFWLISPFIVLFFVCCLVLAGLRHAFKIRNALTWWSDNVLTSLDQSWQVLFAPLLNLGVKTEHKFGYADETASSVCGKNLLATGEMHWRIIEKVVSVLLEGGKPHSVPSIEDDEGSKPTTEEKP